MKKRTRAFMRYLAVIVLMLSVIGVNTLYSNVTTLAANDDFNAKRKVAKTVENYGDSDKKVEVAGPSASTNKDSGLSGSRNGFVPQLATVLDFDFDSTTDYAVIQCLSCGGSRPSQDKWESSGETSWTPRKQRGLKLLAGNPDEAKKKRRKRKIEQGQAKSFGVAPALPTDPGSDIRWHIKLSNDGSTFDYDFGTTSDFFIPADYDGDGRWDIGIWRPSDQYFYVHITGSANGAYETYGPIGDEYSDPTVTGDYDGDGKADPAVFTGTEWISLGGATHTTQSSVSFGTTGVFPAPGDYNGDGKYDFAYQTADPGNPSPAHFYIDYNGAGNAQGTADLDFVFGNFADVIVPGDYDGDGMTDIATANYQTPSIEWSIRFTAGGTSGPTAYGDPSIGYTAQGDYDADGITDLGFWSNSPIGIFYYDDYATSAMWGDPSDYPVAYFNSH